MLGKCRCSPRSDRRHLVKEFTLAHVARKVVGVGSVGTRAWVVPMDAADGDEPLVLQAKEAQPSVLAEFAGRSQHKNEGVRVVAGQHLMQAQARPFGPVTVAKASRLLHGIMATAVEDGLMPQPCNTKGAGEETPTSAPWSRLRHSSSYSTACPNDTGRC